MPTYPISRYLNVRQAYGPTISSDGRRLAFLTDITGTPQVWQVPALSGEAIRWPEQLTFDADRVAAAEYSPAAGDGRLIYARDLGGNEQMQLYLLEPESASVTCLTEGHEDAMHIPGRWSDDGRQILFAANRRHPGLFDLYVQDLPAGGERPADARLVWRNDDPGYLHEQCFAPDGRHAVVTRVASSFHHDLLEIDLVQGSMRPLLPAGEDVRFIGVRYAPDGRSLYLCTDVESDFLYVARLDLDGGALDVVAAPDWDCECLSLSHGGDLLAYAVNVEGLHRLYVVDLATGGTREAPVGTEGGAGTPQGIIADGRLTFSPDGSRLAFSLAAATRTADVCLWDLDQDTVRPVTRSSHGGLPVASFVAPELVRYPTFDRDERGDVRHIPAWFYRPAGDAGSGLPAVVLVHGGPEGQYRPAFHFLTQYLVRNGYAVLAPNVRGSTGYGKAYSHLDDVEKRMDSVADLAHAVHWLQAQPEIDGARIAVYGGSYGGFMVLAALTAYPDLWAAGVDLVGISNLATFLENTSEYRRAHREAEYGSLARDRDFLERIAPVNHLERITAPLIVVHGANDPRVPLSEAEQLVEALRAREVPVQFLVFEDEGHGLVKLHNKRVAYPAIVEFLDRYLKGSLDR